VRGAYHPVPVARGWGRRPLGVAGYRIPGAPLKVSPNHPISRVAIFRFVVRPILSPGRRAVKTMWDPIHVVHVVQDSVVRAPQKYHAPLTIMVNHGSLRSIENPICPASTCKVAGRGVGPVGCHFRIDALSPTNDHS